MTMCDPMTWLDVNETTDDAAHQLLRHIIGAFPLPYPPARTSNANA